MRRIGILGRLGAVLLSTMAHGGWPAEPGVTGTPTRPGHRGSGKSRAAAAVANHRFKSMGRPTAARWWHVVASGAFDPAQDAVVLFAAGKRDRKAEKLNRDMAASVNNNFAHGCGTRGLHLTAVPHIASLNPFHVAH